MPRTVLITGATDGLGLHVARDVAAHGETVIVHGRDPGRVEAAVADVRAAAGHERVRGALADFAELAQVRRLADELNEAGEPLGVLVNNAGIGGPERRQESADGIELTLQVNHLAPLLLTHLVMGLLEQGRGRGRIVNVASAGQAPIDFDDLQLERGYSPMRAYSQSKLAQIAYTVELAERLGPNPAVTVNALHPATLMDTKMVRESFGAARSTIEEGAAAVERLVLEDGFDRITGEYFDGRREARAHAQAYDPEARRRLWDVSHALVGLG